MTCISRISHASTLAAVLLAAACLSAARAGAADFGLADVAAKAKTLAAHPYHPRPAVPRVLQNLSYDQYRSIRFRPTQALWPGNNFRVQFFSPGYLFKRGVTVDVVADGRVRRVPYKTRMFDYGQTDLQGKLPSDLGFAGFRLHYTAHSPPGRKNRPGVDEFLVFQGASYFRAKGLSEKYGLSARGISVNTAGPGKPGDEEFPSFSEFWLVRPPPHAHAMTLYGLLDGPSLTGAYRFRVRPGSARTITDVKAVLFLRKAVAKLGLAPLTSMFMYSVGDHRPPAYLRPAVHDSGGLLVHTRAGEWVWRPLQRPETIHEYTFNLTDPAGFGLLQRNRNFSDYQSLSMHYEDRPSAWITPLSGWGPGKLHLVELPTDVEWQDNIVAFWVSDRPAKPGKPVHFAYRLRWGKTRPDPKPAHVVATRVAGGARPGARTLYVDFAGGRIKSLSANAGVKAYTTISGGKLLSQNLRKIQPEDLWRLKLNVARTQNQSMQLRATLHRGKKNLSETWDYVVPSEESN